MSVQGSEWTANGGRINTAFWPTTAVSPTKLAARFAAWITDGQAQAGVLGLTDADEQDDAVRLWVDYRAWSDIYQFRLANPASASAEGEGSLGFTQGQIDAAREERDTALALYEDAVAGVGAVDVLPQQAASRTVRADFEF